MWGTNGSARSRLTVASPASAFPTFFINTLRCTVSPGPVVPRGEARIRVQISAAHEKDHLDRAIEAFTKVGRDLGVLKN